MFVEHWDWMQRQPDSNLGVEVVVPVTSRIRLTTQDFAAGFPAIRTASGLGVPSPGVYLDGASLRSSGGGDWWYFEDPAWSVVGDFDITYDVSWPANNASRDIANFGFWMKQTSSDSPTTTVSGHMFRLDSHTASAGFYGVYRGAHDGGTSGVVVTGALASGGNMIAPVGSGSTYRVNLTAVGDLITATVTRLSDNTVTVATVRIPRGQYGTFGEKHDGAGSPQGHRWDNFRLASAYTPDPIGDNENPYRLEWFESPDLGAAIDDLATNTPFDYVEDHWFKTETTVAHRITVAWPRAGTFRDDLRFALGENIIDTVPVSTSEEYANDIIGIGNGEGATLVYGRAAVSDGRLRRTRTLTDKTITNVATLQSRIQRALMTVSPTLDLSTVTIKDHPNARIKSINVGDDIRVMTYLPTYGDVDMWVRVLSIGESDDVPGVAVLGVQRSTAFDYNPLEGLS